MRAPVAPYRSCHRAICGCRDVRDPMMYRDPFTSRGRLQQSEVRLHEPLRTEHFLGHLSPSGAEGFPLFTAQSCELQDRPGDVLRRRGIEEEPILPFDDQVARVTDIAH